MRTHSPRISVCFALDEAFFSVGGTTVFSTPLHQHPSALASHSRHFKPHPRNCTASVAPVNPWGSVPVRAARRSLCLLSRYQNPRHEVGYCRGLHRKQEPNAGQDKKRSPMELHGLHRAKVLTPPGRVGLRLGAESPRRDAVLQLKKDGANTPQKESFTFLQDRSCNLQDHLAR